jgi:diguanylate cyclase (GGDEF)-like protein
LFIKGQEAREKELATLSNDISTSLDIKDTVNIFKEFLITNAEMETAYICVLDESGENYRVAASTQEIILKNFTLSKDNPLVDWLKKNNHSITYHEFCRTKDYRSMWETEKNAINSIAAELILPIACDNVLMGIVLFSPKGNNRQYTFAEKSFLESAVSIVAIAFKNASLYAEMQNEARRDALTGLYNRSYFLRQIKEDFDISRHDKFTLLLLSLDDFRLFNELYGVSEGDIALRTMADILQKVVAAKGTVSRYGGKEFMVSLPFCDALTAENLAQECRLWLNRYLKSEEHKTRKTLTFCVGICSYPISASNLDDLLSYTSMAVYSAKKNGKNNTFVYAKQQGEATASVEEEAQKKRQLSENCASTIYALTAAIDAKDHYTFKHSNNVSKYSSVLAEAISLDIEHVEIIRQAGLLHDLDLVHLDRKLFSVRKRNGHGSPRQVSRPDRRARRRRVPCKDGEWLLERARPADLLVRSELLYAFGRRRCKRPAFRACADAPTAKRSAA